MEILNLTRARPRHSSTCGLAYPPHYHRLPSPPSTNSSPSSPDPSLLTIPTAHPIHRLDTKALLYILLYVLYSIPPPTPNTARLPSEKSELILVVDCITEQLLSGHHFLSKRFMLVPVSYDNRLAYVNKCAIYF